MQLRMFKVPERARRMQIISLPRRDYEDVRWPAEILVRPDHEL